MLFFYLPTHVNYFQKWKNNNRVLYHESIFNDTLDLLL